MDPSDRTVLNLLPHGSRAIRRGPPPSPSRDELRRVSRFLERQSRMLRTPFHRPILAIVIPILAAACVPTPPGGLARDANTAVPDGYGANATSGSENTALVDWRDFFQDPNLITLIDAALENNQELNIMMQEILVANSEVLSRSGDYLPSVGVRTGAGIERVGEYTSQGQSDEAHEVPANLQDYTIGLYATWEVDIWRRLRNLRDAALHRYLASVEGRNFMVTRIVAEIASAYYELIALDLQLEVLGGNIELQENSLEIVRLQQQAARVTQLAVTRFEAQLRGFQSRQYEVRQQIVETENRINFLAGRFPQHVERDSANFLDLVPPGVQSGLPTQLLENRPDVRRAELLMEAAALDVKAARARFYPALSLDAGVGYHSYDITQLFNTPGSLIYSLFANLTAPLLNRRGITGEYFGANASQMQAVLTYEQSILQAYIDVVNRLAMVENIARSYDLKKQQVDQLIESIEISNLLFNSARADYLEVLTTRRDSLEAQVELIEIKLRQMTTAIQLYQALGGGWSRPEDPEDDNEQTPPSSGSNTDTDVPPQGDATQNGSNP